MASAISAVSQVSQNNISKTEVRSLFLQIFKNAIQEIGKRVPPRLDEWEIFEIDKSGMGDIPISR